jgi:CRISPR-associated protein Cas6
MFWQEDEDKSLPYTAPDDVFDLSFATQCKELPIDHAWALSTAITQQLPWLNEEKYAGIHQIHVAESGNGWMRPEDAENETLHPSHRTRLVLRIPKARLEDANTLVGKTLSIQGYPLTVKKPRKKPLVNASVIFARYVLSDKNETENDFLERMAKEYQAITGNPIKKMLCGKSYVLRTANKEWVTRHLMLADQSNDDSIALQQFGLGEARLLGCGLFLPHKGIKSLHSIE